MSSSLSEGETITINYSDLNAAEYSDNEAVVDPELVHSILRHKVLRGKVLLSRQ